MGLDPNQIAACQLNMVASNLHKSYLDLDMILRVESGPGYFCCYDGSCTWIQYGSVELWQTEQTQ